MRHTSSHTKNRRSHHALKNKLIVKDKESGALRLPHRIDETTGIYRGKQILPKKEVAAAKKDHKKRLEAHKDLNEEGIKVPAHVEMAADNKVAKKTGKGLFGRANMEGKAKARSGMGGVAGGKTGSK